MKAANDLDMKCDNTKRAPHGALEEIGNENLEIFSVDELQDVMVNLQESDIFYNKFMYNIINPIDNTVRTQELADLDDIIEAEVVVNIECNDIYPLDSLNKTRYLKFQRDLYSITFGVLSLNALDFKDMVK